MSLTMLPEESDNLFALATAIANVLNERHADSSTATDAEAKLRASIAAAAFARGAYEAILEGARQSPGAIQFIEPARRRNERTEQQLRGRMTTLIAQIHILLDPDDASSMAEFVLSMR